MKSKDVRAHVFLHPARQTDCVVEVKIVECSYDVESTLSGAVICCQVEFIPEVIKALRQAHAGSLFPPLIDEREDQNQNQDDDENQNDDDLNDDENEQQDDDQEQDQEDDE